MVYSLDEIKAMLQKAVILAENYFQNNPNATDDELMDKLYEYFSAYAEGYSFTDEEGIYEKDGHKYKFSSDTRKFLISTMPGMDEIAAMAEKYKSRILQKLFSE